MPRSPGGHAGIWDSARSARSPACSGSPPSRSCCYPALVISVSIVGTVVGLALVVAALGIARGLGGLHRRVQRIATGEQVGAPAPFRPGTGLLSRLDRRLRDRNGWRAVGYAVVKLPLALAEGYAVVAVAIGVAETSRTR